MTAELLAYLVVYDDDGRRVDERGLVTEARTGDELRLLLAALGAGEDGRGGDEAGEGTLKERTEARG